jgi:hypothetical protein
MDIEKIKTESRKIALKEKEATITELLHWVKANLKDEAVADFTRRKFSKVSELIDALQQVYQALGVRGDKGLESDFMLFIAGSNKNKVYVSYSVALTAKHKEAFSNILGAQLEEIDQNLSRLTWR